MSLEASLKRHRNRLRLRTFLLSLAACLGSALLAAGAVLLLGAWFDWNVAPLAALLAGTFGAVLAAGLITVLRGPSLERTARLLEAGDSQLHSRLSTALELLRTGQTETPVRSAQLRDARDHAARLIPAERIHLHLPAPFRNVLLAGTALLAAGVLLSEPLAVRRPVPATTVTASQETFTDDEQAALSTNLQQLADLFAETDEAGDDPYLQAISRQLQDLGERMEASELSREQVSAELERLLQHTRTALELQDGERQQPELAQLPELLEAALRDVNQEQLAQDQAAGELPENAGNPAPEGLPLPGSEQAQAEAGQPEPPSLEEMLQAGEQLETGEGGSQAAGSDQPRSHGSYYDHAIDERTIAELNARAMDAASQAAGEAIGASPESQEGASSMAGEGTDDLFGSDAAAQLNAERLEQMNIPEETDPGGRHVRIEVTPEAELTEVRMTPLGQISWDRQQETEVEREALVTEQRLVTARYHTPEQAE